MISNNTFLETLFMDNYSYIKSLVMRITQDAHQAEDIVHDTFLEALKAIDKVKDHPHPQGWLVVTARNIRLRYYRKAQYQAKLLDVLKTLNIDSNDMDGDSANLLKGLNLDDQKILTMFYLEQMSTREIAEALGIKESTARSRLSRARKHLEIMLRLKKIIRIFVTMCNNLSSGWH
ncbi:MAG: sigma-70 family RNA polymerase sigma factor [Oscillospiraceae bacterium]|nr:sigma-70 family RNA polymerase sigma factor [Oscillospiraceae bacterium]